MDPFCLLQLADDTNLLAETIRSITIKFSKLFAYALKKLQRINTKKTKYMHLSEERTMEQIILDNGETIDPVDPNDGYAFLGFLLSYSEELVKIIEHNLTKKMSNVAKFYAWLQYNENTPFFVKMKVLYACLFESILYSVEAWGDIEGTIEKKLRKVEVDALKRCLGVKSGTSNDLVYMELQRPDIISSIKDRQYNFLQKIMLLTPEDAIVKSIWDLCDSNDEAKKFTDYYKQLNKDNKEKNISSRKNEINSSNNTMNKRYVDLIGMKYCNTLYSSTLLDSKRKIITRWRLSCHKLKIETGRYTSPKTPREDRKCALCGVIDDEKHALFDCKAHRLIRREFQELLCKTEGVMELLNPSSVEDATRVANYLEKIEENMKDLCL